MKEQRLREILGRILGIDPSEVGAETSFWTLESWDSVRHVRILTAVEEAFGLRLTAEEAGRLLDYPALVDALAQAPEQASEKAPVTADPGGALRGVLETLPLPTGATVLVHSSLRSLGPHWGTPEAVLQALMDWVEARGGTLVLPTMSGRSTAADFDRDTTPTEGMGLLPELFRRRPDTRRSAHPLSSFTARGPQAEAIVAHHPLDRPEGPDGPMGRMLERDAWVLLLGVDHEVNTTVHLAEYLAQVPYIRPQPLRGAGSAKDGATVSAPTFIGLQHCDACTFRPVGVALARAGRSRRLDLGDAEGEFFSMAAAVEEARSLLARDPLAFLCGAADCPRCGPYLGEGKAGAAVPTESRR
jgi:aminoglycoside 3-N-acetyltransferase